MGSSWVPLGFRLGSSCLRCSYDWTPRSLFSSSANLCVLSASALSLSFFLCALCVPTSVTSVLPSFFLSFLPSVRPSFRPSFPPSVLSPPKKQKSRKSLRPAADHHTNFFKATLAGGESSLSYKPRETFAVLAPLAIPHQGRPRKTRGLSGQVAETPPAPSRVRFEFAGRAHCREFTPNPVINPTLLLVNMKSRKYSLSRQKSLVILECGGLPPLFHPLTPSPSHPSQALCTLSLLNSSTLLLFHASTPPPVPPPNNMSPAAWVILSRIVGAPGAGFAPGSWVSPSSSLHFPL